MSHLISVPQEEQPFGHGQNHHARQPEQQINHEEKQQKHQ